MAIHQVSVNSKTRPPMLDETGFKEVITEIFGVKIAGGTANSYKDAAYEIMAPILAEQFKLDKHVTWAGFVPYKLPIDGIFHPFICIEYGNIEWANQVGGNLVIVGLCGQVPSKVYFGDPKAIYRVTERLAWGIELIER